MRTYDDHIGAPPIIFDNDLAGSPINTSLATTVFEATRMPFTAAGLLIPIYNAGSSKSVILLGLIFWISREEFRTSFGIVHGH